MVGARVTEKLLELDRKIPVWGVLLLGLAFAGWVWNEVRSIDRRLTEREVSSQMYRNKVDIIDIKVQEVSTLRGDINTLKELLIRIERKIDAK